MAKQKREKKVPMGPALNQTDEQLDADALDIEALKRAVQVGWEQDAPEGVENLLYPEIEER